MSGRVKMKMYYIADQSQQKYESEQLIYEQTVNEEWLSKINPDYFQKVICAFNGIEIHLEEK